MAEGSPFLHNTNEEEVIENGLQIPSLLDFLQGYLALRIEMNVHMKSIVAVIVVGILTVLSGCGRAPRMEASVFEELAARGESRALTLQDISDLKDTELEQTVVDNIIEDLKDDGAGLTAEKITSLNKGQRAVYITWILQAKIFKGGLEYYFERTSATITSNMIESLWTLGADHYAGLITQANAVNDSMKAGKVSAGVYPLADLDDTYDSLMKTESLDLLKVRYIRSHPEEFLHN